MTAIILQQLRRYRGQILGWGIGLAFLGMLLMPFYDTLQQQGDQFQQLLESYPPEFMAFFGGDFESFTTPSGYLSAEYFALMPVIVGIFMVLAGSGLLVSDEENGTLDLIMAHPVSRTALFLGRLLAFAMATIAILSIAWLGLAGAAVATDFPATAVELARPYFTLFGVLSFFGTLSLLLSLWLPSRRLAAMSGGLLLVASYFITSLANINEDLESAADFSPLTYYQSGKAMEGLDGARLLGLLGFTALFALLAWWRFQRRDIRVAGEGGWQLSLPWRRSTI